jgi:methyltransferase (TIGR00027 family)
MRDDPSQTAESVCLFRAADRQRPAATRILDDGYAELFLGTATRTALAAFRASGWLGRRAEKRVPGLATFVVTRHRQIDEWLHQALEGSVVQVVVLGAGYDTRAYRFAKELRGRPLFELDHAAIQERKLDVVAQHARKLPEVDVRHVAVDFESDRLDVKLLAAGFQPGARTFFVWEGATMYRTRDALKSTLQGLRAVAGLGSELALDWWYLLDDPVALGAVQRAGASLLHLLEPVTLSMHPEDVSSFLEREGYEQLELVEADDLERRYVRDERSVYPASYLTLCRTR